MDYYLISEEELKKIKEKIGLNIDNKKYDSNKINVKKIFYAETEEDVTQYINDKISEYCRFDDNDENKSVLKNKIEEIENFYWSNMNNANDRDILFELFNNITQESE